MTESSASLIALREAPIPSSAPHLIRLSMTFLFVFLRSMRRVKSCKEQKGPPSSRASMIETTAPSPTFFTALSPKTIFPSVT